MRSHPCLTFNACAGRTEAGDAGLSFTELLTMDGDALTPAQPNGNLAAGTHPNFDPYAFPVPGGVVTQGRSYRRSIPLSEPPAVLPAPLPHQTTTFGHGPNASWLKLVPPPTTPGANPLQQPRQARPMPTLLPAINGLSFDWVKLMNHTGIIAILPASCPCSYGCCGIC